MRARWCWTIGALRARQPRGRRGQAKPLGGPMRVNDLFAQCERHAGGLTRMLLPLCGRTPLNAVVAALLTIVVVSFYVSLVTRPVVSVLFAVLVFSAVKAGLIAIHGLD